MGAKFKARFTDDELASFCARNARGEFWETIAQSVGNISPSRLCDLSRRWRARSGTEASSLFNRGPMPAGHPTSWGVISNGRAWEPGLQSRA